MATPPAARDESSDNDSSWSSSLTALTDSRSSWISDAASCSSASVQTSYASSPHRKPHKANQSEWEAISRVRESCGGAVGLEHFKLVRRLGSGDLGNVYLCRLRDPRLAGCLYAMKVVDKEALAVRKKLRRAETEREILRLLDHPFLPTLYADFDASHYACLVMEFCAGGDLHAARQRLPARRFPLAAARFYAAETVLALEYLHMMGVVYRDLKPENVLLRADGHIMLSDFDLSLRCHVVPRLLLTAGLPPAAAAGDKISPVLSCIYSGVHRCRAGARKDHEEPGDQAPEAAVVAEPTSVRSKSFVGTHEYLAPEVIAGGGHGSAVDWWTLGVFLYEMLYGRTPFKGEENEGTLANIMKQPLRFPRAAPAGGKAERDDFLKAEDLIARLLVKNPRRRMGSCAGAAEIKRHDFFRGVNWALIRSAAPPEVPRLEPLPAARATAKVAPAAVQCKLMSKKQREATFRAAADRFDYF